MKTLPSDVVTLMQLIMIYKIMRINCNLSQMPFDQLEKSAIVRLYEKYSVDFRMFGYDSQVLVISNHLLSLTTLKKPKIWHIMVM